MIYSTGTTLILKYGICEVPLFCYFTTKLYKLIEDVCIKKLIPDFLAYKVTGI